MIYSDLFTSPHHYRRRNHRRCVVLAGGRGWHGGGRGRHLSQRPQHRCVEQPGDEIYFRSVPDHRGSARSALSGDSHRLRQCRVILLRADTGVELVHILRQTRFSCYRWGIVNLFNRKCSCILARIFEPLDTLIMYSVWSVIHFEQIYMLNVKK